MITPNSGYSRTSEDMAMTGFTHFNQDGKAHMVDVGSKDSTRRTAVTIGWISMLPETLERVRSGGHKKGGKSGHWQREES